MTLASGGGSSPSATWEANISFTQWCLHQNHQQVRPTSMTGDFPTCGFFMVQWLQFGLYRIYLQLQPTFQLQKVGKFANHQPCLAHHIQWKRDPQKGAGSHGRSGGLRAWPKQLRAWPHSRPEPMGKLDSHEVMQLTKTMARLDTGLYWKMTPTHSSPPTLLRSPYPTPNTPTQIPTASALLTKPGCLGRCGSHQCPRVGDAVWCFDGCRVASRSAAFIAPSKAMEEPTAMPRTPPPEKNGDEKQISFRSNQQKSMNSSKNWFKLGNEIHLKGSAAMICQGGYNKA